MKRVFFILVLIINLIIAPLKSNAQKTHFDFVSKNENTKIYYKIVDKVKLNAEVTYKNNEFASYKGNVIIPDTVRWRGKTYNIIGIGDSSFFACEDIDTIIFAQTIQYVGIDAFNLSNPKHIQINSDIQSIKTGAFRNVKAINSFVVSKYIKQIGDYAFENSGLENLTIESQIFQSDKGFNNISSLKTITIDTDVQTFSDIMFEGCNNIETVYYNAENFLGYSPLENKSSIKEVIIGNYVQSLPENFITNCYNIKSIKLPENLHTIHSMAFAGSSIKEIKLNNNLQQMGNSVFQNCKQLQQVYLPDNLAVIVDNMFAGCENLTEIYLPQSIENIGNNAFDDCISLEYMDIASKTPPQLQQELILNNNTIIRIDCSQILAYKHNPYWQNLNYDCDTNDVTVQTTAEREVFDTRIQKNVIENILTTGDLSYIVTSEYNKTVAVVAPAQLYRQDMTKHINIPSQISSNGVLYKVNGIESLGTCQSVYIPESIEIIYDGALSDNNLQEIIVSDNNPKFISIDGILYEKRTMCLIAYPSKKAEQTAQNGTITLPEQTKSINASAFTNCQHYDLLINNYIEFIGHNQQIKRFIIATDNPFMTTDGKIIYNKTKNTIQHAVKNYTPTNRVLIIDSNITKIQPYAFATAKFDTLKVNCKTPPVIEFSSFDLNKSFICLVPAGTLNAYKNEEYWSEMNLQEQKAIKNTKKRNNKKTNKK